MSFLYKPWVQVTLTAIVAIAILYIGNHFYYIASMVAHKALYFIGSYIIIPILYYLLISWIVKTVKKYSNRKNKTA